VLDEWVWMKRWARRWWTRRYQPNTRNVHTLATLPDRAGESHQARPGRAGKPKLGRPSKRIHPLDVHYQNLEVMPRTFQTLGRLERRLPLQHVGRSRVASGLDSRSLTRCRWTGASSNSRDSVPSHSESSSRHSLTFINVRPSPINSGVNGAGRGTSSPSSHEPSGRRRLPADPVYRIGSCHPGLRRPLWSTALVMGGRGATCHPVLVSRFPPHTRARLAQAPSAA
jgi:hypothetical protein